MRPVELVLGGVIVVLLALGVVALLTDGDDLPDFGRDDEAVEGDGPADGDDDREVAEGPDQPDAAEGPAEPDTGPERPDVEPAPGTEGGASEPPADADQPDTEPDAGQPGTGAAPAPQADDVPRPDDGRRIAVDEPKAGQRAAPDASPPELPHTGGVTTVAVGLALLAASGLLGLVRLRASG